MNKGGILNGKSKVHNSFKLEAADFNFTSARKSTLWGGPSRTGEKIFTLCSSQPGRGHTLLQASNISGAA